MLTIIAYYQPTTRAYVDQIRGVDSSYTVGLLLDRQLIEECGRLQVPGRPRLYRTTQAFLRAFHLNSLDDLPQLPGTGRPTASCGWTTRRYRRRTAATRAEAAVSIREQITRKEGEHGDGVVHHTGHFAVLFFLLSLLRIGVRADFVGSLADTSVTGSSRGPARIQMLPKPDKPEKPKKPKKEKKKKTPQEESTKGKEKNKAVSVGAGYQDASAGGVGVPEGRTAKDAAAAADRPAGAVGGAAGSRWTRRGRRSCTAISTPDMWTVMPQLEQLTRIPDPGLHVEVDFDSEQLRLTGRLGVSLQIRDLFAIGWAFAKPVIRWLLAMRKRQSAAEKARAAQSAAQAA